MDVVWGGGRGAFEGACVDWRIRATGEETERTLVVNPAAWLIPRWGVRVQYLQPQLDRCKPSSIISHTAWSTNSGTERKRLTSVEPVIKAIVRSCQSRCREGRTEKIFVVSGIVLRPLVMHKHFVTLRPRLQSILRAS